MSSQPHILDLNFSDWQTHLLENGFTKFRASQVFGWLHKRLVLDPTEMKNLPMKLIEHLLENFTLCDETSTITQSNKDETAKVLFNFANNKRVESVWLPYEKRQSVCVSVQSGCSLDCSFCATGKMKFTGNLSTGEILSQVYLMEKHFSRSVTNVVFMGMGEPFYNFDNSIKAAYILADDRGKNLSNRKITISTSGVFPKIVEYVESNIPFSLALSLHSAIPEKRQAIMDIEKKYPITQICSWLEKNRKLMGKKQLMLEYIMIDNFNMEDEDAKALIKLTKRLNAKVNLIPLNTDFGKMKRPSDKAINNFWLQLVQNNLIAVNRASPGKDINGACGMLALADNHPQMN